MAESHKGAEDAPNVALYTLFNVKEPIYRVLKMPSISESGADQADFDMMLQWLNERRDSKLHMVRVWMETINIFPGTKTAPGPTGYVLATHWLKGAFRKDVYLSNDTYDDRFKIAVKQPVPQARRGS